MSRRLLYLIVIVGLVLRLAYGLSQDHSRPYEKASSDTYWYLANAYALSANLPLGSEVNGMVTDVSTLGQPPIFLLLTGLPQTLFSTTTVLVDDDDGEGQRLSVGATAPEAMIIVRVMQAFLSAATCFFAYQLAYRLALIPVLSRTHTRLNRAEIAGLIAAAALAFSPVFVMEAADIKTETVFIFFVTAGMMCFSEALVREPRRTLMLVLVGILLGLATLTRAVFLLFPLALVVYLLIVGLGWRRAALLLVTYGLVVSTWTVYNLARWNRLVIAGSGLAANVYVGATGWDDPEAVDQRLIDAQATRDAAQATPSIAATADPEATPRPEMTATPVTGNLDFETGASSAILSDIPGYIQRRITDLAGAYLQPHGTLFFPGESLRELLVKWLRNDRSLNGLGIVVQGDSFWAKLLIYVLHYTALIFGVIGMWRVRRHWRVALPMMGFIAYITLIHLFLHAIPRYLFPTMVFWWVFAAVGLVRTVGEVKEVREVREVESDE